MSAACDFNLYNIYCFIKPVYFLTFVASLQYVQLGLVGGSVSQCGDKEYIPSFFTRLDHPAVANFLATPVNAVNESPMKQYGKSDYYSQ